MLMFFNVNAAIYINFRHLYLVVGEGKLVCFSGFFWLMARIAIEDNPLAVSTLQLPPPPPHSTAL